MSKLFANVELRSDARGIKLKALVDSGASKSIISKKLAEALKAFTPLKEPYELKTANEEGKLRIVGRCMVDVVFQGVKVPGGAVFEVAENLRKDVDLIIGRPEIDSWDISANTTHSFTSVNRRGKERPSHAWFS